MFEFTSHIYLQGVDSFNIISKVLLFLFGSYALSAKIKLFELKSTPITKIVPVSFRGKTFCSFYKYSFILQVYLQSPFAIHLIGWHIP